MDLRNVRGEAEVLRNVGVVLWWMVPVGNEPDAQIIPTLEPPRLVDVVADLLNIPRSGGDVAALAPCAVLYENQVADGRLPRVSLRAIGIVGPHTAFYVQDPVAHHSCPSGIAAVVQRRQTGGSWWIRSRNPCLHPS